MKKLSYSLLLLGFLVLGCALESKYSLPKNETIDPDLLGTWIISSEDSNDELIIVETFDEMTYKLIFDDHVLTAHSATIKGHRIMNIIDTEDGDETPNIFYGFSLKKNKLKIMEVTDQLTDADFGSQQELIDFFEQHIDRPDFFVNPDILKRK
jgi:hypothetical protein